MKSKINVNNVKIMQKTYKKYTCEFEDSQDEAGDHAFAILTFPGDVDVPEDILVEMVRASDDCGITHAWELTETRQFEDEARHHEFRGDGEISCTEYIMHREN